ncbi:aminotransferase class I/II-fold pyridoxal phosphate-dependent enzyme [Oceanicella actignis]|uniref:Aspartate/methionine/tyrosine aminotransferase n=1 Tax=Oceanicella actignis TaxID=1189325 RepID=A0A1M7T981_9RHOB|nr:aminotransferase class I/II-fold pyridoxal phosphate-dependent enzyme [Oceanicella actignis]SET50629.1 Aspartate/methionine/tyrosine aminotransferase [Oceanicella actignis]SHN67310.1 Aspartate/methionine/tyrosine aminotransferase [Oceanicella actignis]
MQMPERFQDLPDYAFPRLRALLDAHAPGGPVLAMSIGEPRHPPPPFVAETLARHADEYGRYPPNEGTPGLRDAIAAWLRRRYGLSEERADPDRHVLPLNGTREGLFAACLALCPERKNGARPAVLMPNPFYQCYGAAALAAGAEPVYVPATPESGHLPDYAALPADLLARTAAVYVCSPANPQGAVASAEWWRALIDLAERHDFRIFADECYAEIHRGDPPPGALEAAQAAGADPERVLAFHSLSKRSNLPGLRSGFCAGGPKTIAAMLRLRAYGGAPLPLPAQHAAEAAWRDEAHVERNRALYRRKFDEADRILGDLPGYASPAAGFFLWLHVGDGEAAALELWRGEGVRALPGAYLSRPAPDWLGGGDPGAAWLRVALVAPEDETRRGLEAIRRRLGPMMARAAEKTGRENGR